MASARGVSWARLRVIVVSAAALAILSVLVYLLTGGTLLTEKATLYLLIPDATGLEPGSAVRVNGIAVGKVDSVALSGSNEPNRIVRLVMKLENDKLSDIPVDSTAQIGAEGVQGDRFVDITQGRAPAHIRANSEIMYKSAPELVKTLDLQQFTQQLRLVDATITDIEQGKGRVGEFVVGTEMYEDLRKALADVDKSFRQAVSATGNVGGLLRTDQWYRQMRDPVMELDSRLARIQSGQGSLGRLLRDDGQYNRLREQAASLRKSIGDFRKEPFLTSDELYLSWNRGFGSLIQRVDGIDSSPMFRTSETYDNLNGFLHDLRTTVHDFRESPQKFMRLKLF